MGFSFSGRTKALQTILSFLSAAVENRVYMGSKDLGLLPALVAVVTSDNGDARVKALGALLNLSIAVENKVYMGSKDLGLLPALVAVITSDNGDARVMALGALWDLSLYRGNIEYLVCCNGMPVHRYLYVPQGTPKVTPELPP